jgi:hypothetical protein
MTDIAENQVLMDSIIGGNQSSSHCLHRLQIFFEILNDGEQKEDNSSLSLSSKVRPLYVPLTDVHDKRPIWTSAEELIYIPILIDTKKLQSSHSRELYTYDVVDNKPQDVMHTNVIPILSVEEEGKEKAKLVENAATSTPSPEVNMIKPKKLGTLFELRCECSKTILGDAQYFTMFDRYIVRCSDGVKMPIDIKGIVLAKLPKHSSTGFNISNQTNTVRCEDTKNKIYDGNHDYGVYISTLGDEIAVVVSDDIHKLMYCYIYHTRQLLEYDSSINVANRAPISFTKRQFSYWPIIDRHGEITWIHGYWIVIFRVLGVICCYNSHGVHVSTLPMDNLNSTFPIDNINIIATYEGRNVEDCKLAFWQNNNIFIWRLSEMLTFMPPTHSPFDIDVSDDDQFGDDIDDNKISQLRELQHKWTVDILKFQKKQRDRVTSTYYSNTESPSNSYLGCQWLDANTLVVHFIPYDKFDDPCLESRLFYIRMLPVVSLKSDVLSLLTDEKVGIDYNSRDQINRFTNTCIVTKLRPHLQTTNCYIDREIILKLPNTRLNVQMYIPPSQHHIRFEFDCLLTFLQTKTNLFDTLLPVVPLTTLMLQYLY